MNAITLYTQDRNRPVSALSQAQRSNLLTVLRSAASQNGVKDTDAFLEHALSLRVSDLDSFLNVHYVDKNRDLSTIQPIASARYFIDYTRGDFQPLLDALSTGDFELAARLTPENYRLCGYQVFREVHTEEEHGIGWAGQYCYTQIPPGVYPVFATHFAFHEGQNQFTNQIKDFNGLRTWLEGSCVASSSPHTDYPYPNIVYDHPYAHAVAKGVLDGHSNIQLLYPFQAQEVHFQYDGAALTSYKVVDIRLPETLKENPMTLRMGNPQPRPALENQIQAASERSHALEDHSPGGLER